jgi:hypothetical protein
MDHLRLLAETTGFFTRGDALDAGYNDKAIQQALRHKLWTSVRQGAYTFTDLWEARDEIGQHRIRARATMRRLGRNVALSHTSAAIEQDMAVWGTDLSLVHVTRLDGGAGRTEAGVQHHETFCLSEDLVERDGYLISKPSRAALEHSLLVSTDSAVVTLDSGLHRGLFTRGEMEAEHVLMSSWPGARKLQVAVRFADGRAESAGESLSRRVCYKQGLPPPVLQFEVYDENGVLVGVTDFAWPDHRLLGEFDGKVKYGRLLREGEEPGNAVFREKVREDRLREILQWAMVRLIWADLFREAETAARIRRLMKIAA